MSTRKSMLKNKVVYTDKMFVVAVKHNIYSVCSNVMVIKIRQTKHTVVLDGKYKQFVYLVTH
jgi:hypothetical protein